MSRPTPTLFSMSQYIPADAAFLTPVSSPVDAVAPPFYQGPDHTVDPASFNYGHMSSAFSQSHHHPHQQQHQHQQQQHMPGGFGLHSPPSSMLKMRLSPDAESQACLPTHQLFDLAVEQQPSPPTTADDTSSSRPGTPALGHHMFPAEDALAHDEAGGDAPPPSKKPRPSGQRVTTKDFVPPDVSGLSKREARLVKNRAAAFLSRQRKREEFENMEIRVAELEQENARLRGGAAPNEDDGLSEIEQLRAQLAASQQREKALAAQLAETSLVKLEQFDSELPSPASRDRSPSPLQSQPHRSGASLGLMVLLCALPTLLSMPTHSAAPTRFSFPISQQASAGNPFVAHTHHGSFDLESLIPRDSDDWSIAGALGDMDIDLPSLGRLGAAGPPGKLEFADMDGVSEALGLGGLDISFEAVPSQDGKIRVRIHPPSSTTSTDASSASTSSIAEEWPAAFPSARAPTASQRADPLGPFLGVGMDEFGDSLLALSSEDGSGYAFDYAMPDSSGHPGLDYAVGAATATAAAGAGAAKRGKRRVRIALKSMPKAGGEGGEWEVEIC